MDRGKQIDILRKRNIELNKLIDDLKFKIDYNEQLNSEGYKQAKDLINDLEKIRKEWLESIQILREKEKEYDDLISDLQEMKKVMITAFSIKNIKYGQDTDLIDEDTEDTENIESEESKEGDGL